VPTVVFFFLEHEKINLRIGTRQQHFLRANKFTSSSGALFWDQIKKHNKWPPIKQATTITQPVCKGLILLSENYSK